MKRLLLLFALMGIVAVGCSKKEIDKGDENDIPENIFYFVKEPRTLVPEYVNGREELKETLTIVIFGGKPIAKEDDIFLDTGEKFRVMNTTVRYVEHNILVKDMLKPRIESIEVVLE